ncbi:MAG TPA: IS66 family transposase [Chromatiaceae bacterium]|nr:IS66 family transposase [Chromatiaceae bacterium]
MSTEGRAEEAIELVVELLGQLRDKNTELELKVHKLLRKQFGRRGEGIGAEQLSLLLGLLEEESDEDADGARDENADGADENKDDEPLEDEATETTRKKKKKRGGRQKLPEHLERHEKIIRVANDERRCPKCGDHPERVCIGYERSETLEFQPARFFVTVHAREKLACPKCESEIVVAPVADKVFDKGKPGAGLLADILVGKYKDHLPLYRQMQRYRRLGVDIPSSTISDWVGAVLEQLEPIAKEEAKAVLASFLLQTDDTALKVLDREHPANIVRGALWGHIGDSRHCYFFFSPDQKYHWPQDFLEDREGYIQCDAAGCYDALFEGDDAKATEVGCWMHARRYYVRALDAGDLRAAIPLKLIKKLYKIERKAAKARASPEELLEIRREKSKPLYEELGRFVAKHFETEPPKSPLGKALGYMSRQWVALGRFLEDGRLPPDNGAPERLNKIIAVGRRNYLFAGSEAGGHHAATAYSLIGGCELNGIDPWSYFNDVLAKLAGGWPQSRIAELTPANWAAARQTQTTASN